MARDYENIFDLENMDDDDIEALVRQEISEYEDLDPDLVDVHAENGFVRVEGRVGTEQELQEVEHMLSDVIGLASYSNELVVDELVRGERSAAADEEAAEEQELPGSLAEDAAHTDPAAAHLMDDTASEQYGTDDPNQATERGQSYEPPERPTQEGSWSEETH